jgi:poly-beta-1,6-N-acetyl-D-glucosamine synthase
MNKESYRYVIITPVRDEEEFIGATIRSVLAQTIRPTEWVIVNDGSKDNTGEIIEEYARQHPWIQPVHRKDRGFRKFGGGIIEAFYDGFHSLRCQDWELMCKLDGDLSFESNYFERLFKKFQENSHLGIGGGVLYHLENGKEVLERHPLFHVRGGVKTYRRQCWEAIGGLWVGPGTDTVDDVKANMLGWSTMSFAELQMKHHRWTGATDGRWARSIKDGRSDYVCGYHPLFSLAKSVFRLAQQPYVFGSVGLLYGYTTAYFKGVPQVNDAQLIQYLRRQQLGRLFGGETIWK